MGESPAPPRRGPLMLTPLQDSQRRRPDQVSHIRIQEQIHPDICLAIRVRDSKIRDASGAQIQAHREAAVVQGRAQEPAMHAWDDCNTSAGKVK